MCRTYKRSGKAYVRLCYVTGRAGEHVPGRLGVEVEATPSGRHAASGHGRAEKA